MAQLIIQELTEEKVVEKESKQRFKLEPATDLTQEEMKYIIMSFIRKEEEDAVKFIARKMVGKHSIPEEQYGIFLEGLITGMRLHYDIYGHLSGLMGITGYSEEEANEDGK